MRSGACCRCCAARRLQLETTREARMLVKREKQSLGKGSWLRVSPPWLEARKARVCVRKGGMSTCTAAPSQGPQDCFGKHSPVSPRVLPFLCFLPPLRVADGVSSPATDTPILPHFCPSCPSESQTHFTLMKAAAASEAQARVPGLGGERARRSTVALQAWKIKWAALPLQNIG